MFEFKFCPKCGSPVELSEVGRGLIGSQFKCTKKDCGQCYQTGPQGCCGGPGKLTIKAV